MDEPWDAQLTSFPPPASPSRVEGTGPRSWPGPPSARVLAPRLPLPSPPLPTFHMGRL